MIVIFSIGRSCTKQNEKCETVGMAVAVLLRNRSPYMNANQLMLGIYYIIPTGRYT